MGFSPVLDPDKLYLELAFLMMFSWIWDHSLSVLHLGHTHKKKITADLHKCSRKSPVNILESESGLMVLRPSKTKTAESYTSYNKKHFLH